MNLRAIAGLALIPFLLAAAPPAADGWRVSRSGDSVVLMRRGEWITLEYRTIPKDYSAFKLTVDHCGQGPWSIKDSLAPPGETLSSRTADMRQSIAEDFHNARLNCTLPDGVEARLMDGFDAAYSKFEALAQ